MLMKNMIARGYQDARTLLRRIAKMEQLDKMPKFEEILV
jgi:aconitase B